VQPIYGSQLWARTIRRTKLAISDSTTRAIAAMVDAALKSAMRAGSKRPIEANR
jgi:hypothetical protein